MRALYPWYDTRKTFFWFIWIFILSYIVGIGVYVGVFILNNSTVFTYFKNPGMPGAMLTSLRYAFVDIAIRLSVIGHVLTPIFVMSLVLYRKSKGCNIFWFIFVAIAFLLVFLGFIALTKDYSGCNQNNQFGNLCNSFDWCCVNDIRMHTNNGCPNVLPCIPPKLQSDLSPNTDFLGLYWTNFILGVFQITFITVIIVYWRKDPTEDLKEMEARREILLERRRRRLGGKRTRSLPPPPLAEKGKEITINDDEPLVTDLITTTNTKKQKPHGLRQRGKEETNKNGSK